MSKPEERQRAEAWALRQGPSPASERDEQREPEFYQPPGTPNAAGGMGLHIFDPWTHFVLRPWNPARRAHEARHFPYQVAVNACLTALVVTGWTGGWTNGVLAGLGFAAFVVVSAVLLSFVAGELGAPHLGERCRVIAVDASCALVVMLLLLRVGYAWAGLMLGVLYLVALVAGLRRWAGFSRLRALAAVYLAIEVGMVGVGVLGLGLVVALHA